jgi:anti-sigma B factor antagonist/stage II sporulation protein AA (anti-sigma F factor antagonist)
MTDDLLQFEITNGPTTLIALRGELDFANAPGLRRAMDRIAEASETIFDLSGLAFLDSSGLSLIANYARRMLPAGRVTVVAPQSFIRRLFALTGLDSIVTVAETPAD